MAITNLASLAGWSDPDGDPVSFSSAGPFSANGTNVTSDATYLCYNGVLAADDYFPYTITDGKLIASGLVYLKAINVTAVVPSEPDHVISLDELLFRLPAKHLDSGFEPAVPKAELPGRRGLDQSSRAGQLGNGWILAGDLLRAGHHLRTLPVLVSNAGIMAGAVGLSILGRGPEQRASLGQWAAGYGKRVELGLEQLSRQRLDGFSS
jgi:hypothetical protein